MDPALMTPEVLSGRFVDFIGPLAGVVVVSMVVERALGFVYDFELGGVQPFKEHPTAKALIALGLAMFICFQWKIDLLRDLFTRGSEPPATTYLGLGITAMVVAGGSAGAMALFQGYLGIGREVRKAKLDAEQAELSTRKLRAENDLADEEARKKAALKAPTGAVP